LKRFAESPRRPRQAANFLELGFELAGILLPGQGRGVDVGKVPPVLGRFGGEGGDGEQGKGCDENGGRRFHGPENA